MICPSISNPNNKTANLISPFINHILHCIYYLISLSVLTICFFFILDCQNELLNQLIVYYDTFGCRSCCFSDISPYIDLLNVDKRNQVSSLKFYVMIVLFFTEPWLSVVFKLWGGGVHNHFVSFNY